MPTPNQATGNQIKADDFRSAPGSGSPASFQEPDTINMNIFGSMGGDFEPCELFRSDRMAYFFLNINYDRFYLQIPNDRVDSNRLVTSDWADADDIKSAVMIGDFIYVLMVDTGTTPDTWRVYRYSVTNLAAGGTLMTFAGATVLAQTNAEIRMTSDGTSFYFNYQAGNSANSYAVAKYSLSGTTFTYVSTTNLGSTAAHTTSIGVLMNGEYVGIQTGTGDNQVLRRYNSSGTLQATGYTYLARESKSYQIQNSFYVEVYNRIRTSGADFSGVTWQKVPVP